jgi:hypothetical protein
VNTYTIQHNYRYNPITYTKTLDTAIVADEYVTECLRNQDRNASMVIRRNGVLINDLDLRFDAVAERKSA